MRLHKTACCYGKAMRDTKRPGRPNKTGLPPGTEGQRELRLRCAPDLLAAITLRGGGEWVRKVLAAEIATDGYDPVTGFGPCSILTPL